MYLNLILLFGSAILGALPQPDYPPTLREEIGTSWEVSGRVTDEFGAPVPNTDVHVGYQIDYQPFGVERFVSVAKTKTNLTGAYRISVAEGALIVVDNTSYQVFARYAPSGGLMDVTLSNGNSISGRLLLPDGKAAAGATVTPLAWRQADADKEPETYCWPRLGIEREVTTDEDGRFTLRHMPTASQFCIVGQLGKHRDLLLRYDGAENSTKNWLPESTSVDDQFEESFERSNALTVSAIDENERCVKMREIIVRPKNQPFQDRLYKANSFDADVLRPRQLPREVFELLVLPRDDTVLLGKRVVVNGQQWNAGSLDVELRKGRKVRVRVIDEETKEPISGVPIHWGTLVKNNASSTTSQLLPWNSEGDYVSETCLTNKTGQANLLIPTTEGYVGIKGLVPKFQSIEDWNFGNDPRLQSSLAKRFVKFVSSGDETELVEIEFKLRGSFDLEVEIVDQDGDPAPFAVVKTTRRRPNSTLEAQSQVAGANGRVTINEIYANAKFHYFAWQAVKDLSADKRSAKAVELGLSFPISAFSEPDYLFGLSTIPLPDFELPPETIHTKIELHPPTTAFGRIVNTKGEGIPNVEIDVRPIGGGASHVLKTRTRADGRFRMEGVTPRVDLLWTLDPYKVKTKHSSNEIRLSKPTLDPGSVDLGDLICFDLTNLDATLLPNMDSENVDLESYVNKVEAFVQRSLRDLPESSEEFFPDGVENTLAMTRFRSDIEDKVLFATKTFLDTDPSVEAEFRVLQRTSKMLLSNRIDAGDVYSKLRDLLASRLLERQLDNEKAQPLIVQLVVEHQRFEPSEIGKLNLIISESSFVETRLRAAIAMAETCSVQVCNALNEKIPKQEFERHLEKLISSLCVIKDHRFECQKIEPAIARFENQFRKYLRNFEAGDSLSPERLKATKDLFRKYLGTD